ncbi:formin-like protein 14 [Miscanthus floridulus]|uniref:formin-like protein 14 n=1 Tax=Miscanthus floridulus TaxID=154761 RepID=UPI0034596182
MPLPLPLPPAFLPFLLLSLLLLPAATISTSQTNATLPSPPLFPPPPAAAPHPPHRHHHTASPRAPLTPPPPPSLPPTPTPVAVPPAQAPPPTPPPTPAPPVTTSPTPKYPSSSATPSTGDPYPFTNNPFFPTANSPPPPPPAAETQPSGDGGLPTFPANISTLVAPTSRASGSRHFPVLQALLLSLLSLCLLLSALLSIHLVRRLRHRGGARSGAAPSSASAAHRRAASNHDDDDDGDEEGRSLKPPPMPTSSTNPSTEFLYLGTLATPPPSGPQHPGTSSSLRPGSPELRPLPPLPRVGPPSGEFASRSSASDPSTVPPAAAADASSSSPSASSPTLGSSPVHFRPPSIPQPRGRAPNPSPPKRRPSPPKGAAEPVAAHAWNPFVPLPPRPAVASSDDGDSDQMMDLRKSRPLHSDKLKPSSLHMKDEVIQLYLNNSAVVAAPREVCLLGALRCHGIGMIVGALGVSKEQLREALLEGNAHGLGVEALRMLTQMVLCNEEELKLKYFKDDSLSRLCPVDAFLKAMLDVPFAFKRVDAMLYIASFYLEINQLRMSYATLEGACQEIRSSRLFHKVLEAVVNFGNFMNTNSGSPCSKGLEPNTVLKIADVKGADGKAALMQFLVQEIVKPEGYNVMEHGSGTCKMNTSTLQYDARCRKHGLEVVTKLAAELSNTKKAASLDITRLSRSVSELGMGLGKVHDVVRLNSMVTSTESARRFHNSMSTFLRHAEEEILKLQSQESICLSSVKEMAGWFIGVESGNDEAHMFRIFTGVREFLAMLDRICKEAGEVSSNNWVGATTVSWMAAPMGMTP